jgi:carbohydrate-binding DOMON domain-containing protein
VKAIYFVFLSKLKYSKFRLGAGLPDISRWKVPNGNKTYTLATKHTKWLKTYQMTTKTYKMATKTFKMATKTFKMATKHTK